MESIGEKLRKEREEKGWSIDHIARETNITRHYIVALEEEDFSPFPGETYLIGFLRNYAECLGLDHNEIITLYKNLKLQEQPVPIDQLLDKKPSISGLSTLLLGLLVLVIVGGALLVYAFFFYKTAPIMEETIVEAPADITIFQDERGERVVESGTSHRMEKTVFEQRFSPGDSLVIPLAHINSWVRLQEVGTSQSGALLKIDFPAGERHVSLGEDISLDITGDGNIDISLFVTDVDPRSETALLRFSREIGFDSSLYYGDLEVPVAGSPGVEQRAIDPKVILVKEQRGPFQVELKFNGPSMVRYIIDRNEQKELLFERGENLSLVSKQEVWLWISNSGALTANIDELELSLGGRGEVTAHRIYWQPLETGYELKLLPIF